MSWQAGRAVKNFFTLLFSGKISKAEDSLNRLEKKLGNNGYYKALHGIYYAYVTDDRDSFIFQLWKRYLGGEDKAKLKEMFTDLLKEAYDPPKDFIQAWINLIDVIDSLPVPKRLISSQRQYFTQEK
jgi:hypothetical protein